jgi:hypothetical protein
MFKKLLLSWKLAKMFFKTWIHIMLEILKQLRGQGELVVCELKQFYTY